jgi:hypothetical protein
MVFLKSFAASREIKTDFSREAAMPQRKADSACIRG